MHSDGDGDEELGGWLVDMFTFGGWPWWIGVIGLALLLWHLWGTFA